MLCSALDGRLSNNTQHRHVWCDTSPVWVKQDAVSQSSFTDNLSAEHLKRCMGNYHAETQCVNMGTACLLWIPPGKQIPELLHIKQHLWSHEHQELRAHLCRTMPVNVKSFLVGSQPDWDGEAAVHGYHAANYSGYLLQTPGKPSIYVGYNPYSYPLQIDVPPSPEGRQHMACQICQCTGVADCNTML